MSFVGRRAPPFTLYDTNRQPVTLDSFRGRKVLLVFYPAAFTRVCTQEMCVLRDSLAAFEGLNAAVVGISVDGPDANREFAAQNGVTFPLLSDFDRKVVNAYGIAWPNFHKIPGLVVANRAVFVIDSEGYVRWQWIAPHPGEMPPFDEVRRVV